MSAEPIWLDVPIDEKDAAKALGARWNPTERRWYAPRAQMDGLERWAPRGDLPDVLPGEDRSYGQGLFVDLIPSSCWFTNVRSCVDPIDWERLRRMVIKRCGEICEICGARPERAKGQYLDVHERWSYDDEHHHQQLRRLIGLCRDCHRVTHYGYSAQILSIGDVVFAHLLRVTKMTPREAQAHIDKAFALWYRRSRATWSLDLSMLTDTGITVYEPPNAHERWGVAAQRLYLEAEDPVTTDDQW